MTHAVFTYDVTQWLLFFYIYSFFGWIFESTYVSICQKRFVNRGFMRGPFLPLYGSGAVLMLFVATPDYKPCVLGIILVAILGTLVVLVIVKSAGSETFGFRGGRILAWLDPEAYADGKGFQTLQALYAIGSGGLLGKGLGQSMQKLGFIPEAQNDMIFAVICEELGLVGALLLMVLFLLLLWRFMVIATRAPDLFGALIVAGILGHIAIQVILNIAVVTNTIPNTGITLPFVSYGGTSVMFLLSDMGLGLSVSRFTDCAKRR